MKKQHGHTSDSPADAELRAKEVRHVLTLAARFPEMIEADFSRHVLVPAVEATETWCVAAFAPNPSNFESLSGPDLVNEFMCALEKSESRPPKLQYAKIDKSPNRRKSFYETYASQSDRIVASCPRFREAHEQLQSFAARMRRKETSDTE